MYQNRVIPVLLLKGTGLYKTVKFRKPVYVGDPFNAVKIFNEKEVDELVVLDIEATSKSKGPNYDLIRDIATECFMPLAYGGGITSFDQAKQVFNLGIEKVVINSNASNFDLITSIANVYGSQSVIVGVDVKKSLFGKSKIIRTTSAMAEKSSPLDFIVKAEDAGAGEVFLQSVDNDGLMTGYDLKLIGELSARVNVPLVACGGAGSIDDLKEALKAGASAVGAGSMFVFKGKHKAVLINYPSQAQLKDLNHN